MELLAWRRDRIFLPQELHHFEPVAPYKKYLLLLVLFSNISKNKNWKQNINLKNIVKAAGLIISKLWYTGKWIYP
jgi:hypothetical protein